MKTRCVWENTTDNDVSFGENTEDEMCFSFTLYYPKVKADPWIWSLPSFAASMEEN
ncbi:MAG: monooxygenase [Polyangiales bacterium]